MLRIAVVVAVAVVAPGVSLPAAQHAVPSARSLLEKEVQRATASREPVDAAPAPPGEPTLEDALKSMESVVAEMGLREATEARKALRATDIGASAVLTPSADVQGFPLAEERLCLNQGAHILALRRHPERPTAGAFFWPPGRAERTVQDATYKVFLNGEAGWGWTTAVVADPQCYDVFVGEGHLRVYELQIAVAINWE